jgi:hypothetical protein
MFFFWGGQSDFFLKTFIIPSCTFAFTDGLVYFLVPEIFFIPSCTSAFTDGLVYLLVSETCYTCTQHAIFPYAASITRSKLPCWHTLAKNGFIIHFLTRNSNTD